MQGNTVTIYSVLKKTTKLNFQPAQYEKSKIDTDYFGKKHVGKHCSNPQCFKEKKTTKLNSQPIQY